MKSRRVPVYWVIAGFAVLHSLVLLCLANVTLQTVWGTRLWIALATLWFFWPIVLALHSGRSIWRLVISLTLAVVLVFPYLQFYTVIAPVVFELPEGFSLMPWNAVRWTSGYLAGRAEAKRDIKNGRLIIEEYGFLAGMGHRVAILRDRYGIELNATAQCAVSPQISGHGHGYNGVSRPEIEHRYSSNAIQAAFEEGWKLDREDAARAEQHAKDLAKTFFSVPRNSKVMLESVYLYDNNGPIEADLSPDEMANATKVIHWIEDLISSAVPNDASTFESNISAELTSSARPKLEISSSASAPRGVHMQVYNKLDTVPDVRSERERILIAMRFQVRSPR